MKTHTNKRTICPNGSRVLETRLYARRKALGISQQKLAQIIGVSRNCIQQLECHEHFPQISTICKMFQAFGFTREDCADFWLEYTAAYYQDEDLQKERELTNYEKNL